MIVVPSSCISCIHCCMLRVLHNRLKNSPCFTFVPKRYVSTRSCPDVTLAIVHLHLATYNQLYPQERHSPAHHPGNTHSDHKSYPNMASRKKVLLKVCSTLLGRRISLTPPFRLSSLVTLGKCLQLFHVSMGIAARSLVAGRIPKIWSQSWTTSRPKDLPQHAT